MSSLSLDDFKKKYILMGEVQHGVHKLKKRHPDDNTGKISFTEYNASEKALYFIDDNPSYYCKRLQIKEHNVNEVGVGLVLNELIRNNLTGGFPYSECHIVGFVISNTNKYVAEHLKYVMVITEALENERINAKNIFDTNSKMSFASEDFSYGLLCFQLIHNLYISNKYAGFVHGDLLHGNAYNTAYTVRKEISDSGKSHITYRVINSETKVSTYYVFKLKIPGSIPFMIYYDFGLSDVNIPSKGIIGDNFDSRLPNVLPTGAQYRLSSTKEKLNFDQGSKEYRNIKRRFDLKAIQPILKQYGIDPDLDLFFNKLYAPFAQTTEIDIANDWNQNIYVSAYDGHKYDIQDNISLNEKLMDPSVWSTLFGSNSEAFVFNKSQYNDYVSRNGGDMRFYLIGEVNKKQCAHFYERLENAKRYMDKITEYIRDPQTKLDPTTDYSLMHIESHHANDAIKEKYSINLNNRKEGKYQKWHENGHLATDGNYINNRHDGVWQHWYDNDQLKSRATFINGVADGKHNMWYESGELQYEGFYKGGALQTNIWYNKDGSIKNDVTEDIEPIENDQTDEIIKDDQADDTIKDVSVDITKDMIDNTIMVKSTDVIIKNKPEDIIKDTSKDKPIDIKSQDDPMKNITITTTPQGTKQIFIRAPLDINDLLINHDASGKIIKVTDGKLSTVVTENGKSLRIVHHKDHVKDGKEMRISNGLLTHENSYVNNSVNGIIKSWYENGIELKSLTYFTPKDTVNILANYDRDVKIVSETAYNKGVPQSIHTYVPKTNAELQMAYMEPDNLLYESKWPNGQIKVRGMKTSDDKKNGEWVYWYEDGKIQVVNHFNDNIQNGIWIKWHPNGNIWSKSYYDNNELDGQYISWYENGNRKENKYFKNGKVDGEVMLYDSDGKLTKEDYYIDGIKQPSSKTNPIRTYYHNTDKIHEEYREYDGKYEGFYTEWYPNGNLKTRRLYHNSKKSGPETEWYEDGILSAIRNYINGQQHGIEIKRHQNGNITREATYSDDQLHGVEYLWDDNGKLLNENYYENGKLVSEKYSENGIEKPKPVEPELKEKTH